VQEDVLGIKDNFRSKKYCFASFSNERINSGLQFTTHVIEMLVVETKRFVGSFVNVILTRQTCGQRPSRSAESKCQALGNYFSERIQFAIFIKSKCTGDRDLGVCATLIHACGEPQRNGKIRFFLRRNTFFFPEVATAHRFCKRKYSQSHLG